MRGSTFRSPVLLLLLLLPLLGSAATTPAHSNPPGGRAVHFVKPDGTGDFPTIQAAVNASVSGDTILLDDGTFMGTGNRNIDLMGRNLVISGTSLDPASVTIDVQGSAGDPARAFFIHDGQDSTTRIEYMTLTGGYKNVPTALPDSTDGGAIMVRESGPIIQHCIIENNFANDLGGISYKNATGGVIRYNEIRYNSCFDDGGGIGVHSGSSGVIVEHNYVHHNSSASTGGGGGFQGDTIVRYNVFYANQQSRTDQLGFGGGVVISDDVLFEYNTVVCNYSNSRGGGMGFGLGNPTVQNCIIAFNQADLTDGALYCHYTPGQTTSCSNIYGNMPDDSFCGTDAGDNIALDPLFCGDVCLDGEFALQGGSPCLAAPGCGQMGAFGGCSVITVSPAAADCITATNPCLTVPFEIGRVDADDMRGYSLTFDLSPELALCAGLPSIVEGPYLSAIGGTAFQVLDNGGGSYTVDCALLGLPCGQTAPAGTLFTVDVAAAGGDGTGLITVTSVTARDCLNADLPSEGGLPAMVEIDTTPPSAVLDLSATQVIAGNGTADTTGVMVNFTPPAGVAAIEVWAAPFGNYPEYDDAPGAGSVPAAPTYPPGAPWILTSALNAGDTVYLPDRDFWYFAVFGADDCGNVSAVSNVTGGTLNYHLGDVTDGSVNGHGDNLVAIADLSLLGANYGIALSDPDALGYLDVGPTTDFSVNARPTTDNLVDFEDLIVFAINFGQVSAPRSVPQNVGELVYLEPAIALEVTESAAGPVAKLVLVDNPDRVKGIHAFVSLGGMKLVSKSPGALVGEQGAPVFLETMEAGDGVWVDLAVLGRDEVFAGSGEVAVLELQGSGHPSLGEVILRDRNNRSASRSPVDVAGGARGDATGIETVATSGRIELIGARPNPFDASTQIAFRLPAATRVSLTVYDVAGRLVRTLVDREVAAGEMNVSWDGRTNDGQLAGSGIYFYTFQTPEHRETRKLLRMN